MTLDLDHVEERNVIELSLEDERYECDGFTIYRIHAVLIALTAEGRVSLFRQFESEQQAIESLRYVLEGPEQE